jgi:DNA polymerase I-like protein with 3'-5' exonuclease and polymerase domains
MFWPVLQTMQRGVRIDLDRRNRLINEVQDEIARREQFLCDILGHPLNPRSFKQMSALFYDDLQQPEIKTRAKKGIPGKRTLNDEALQLIALREPLLKPIINAISDIRTMGIFLSNFLTAPLDEDQRMRCAYNIGGSESGKSAPKTYRLSSSENAFGSGTNLQNVPSEKSKSLGKAAARGATVGLGDPYSYPNIRSMFIPDPGYTFFDGDLDRADLQVVVWEADDEMLKAALRMGVDMHLMNTYSIEGKEPPPLEELVETHPKYWDYRGPRKVQRENAKSFVHGTNYGGKAVTMSKTTGKTVHETERAQQRWFAAHPGIQRWHDRIKIQISSRRFVENRFGYRWYIFDRVESVVPEAIAWIPQSTVSVLINRIWENIYRTLPEVQVLLQVHDSLAGQFPSHLPSLRQSINEAAKITIPYEDPLIIPFNLKTSQISWGDCA